MKKIGDFVKCNLVRAVFVAALLGQMSALGWQMAEGPLATRWAKAVSPQNVHREYPRPQMVRKEWMNLNGLWDLAIASKDASRPEQFTDQILVPFPVESALSGLMKRVSESDRLWYRRSFEIPKSWRGRRVLLHFGAVDFETRVWVNGKEVGQHRGGYDKFYFDISDALYPFDPNELIVEVWDPTDAGSQPRGKQVRKPGGIWYTPSSGIWQTVWLEPVSAAHIAGLKIVPNLDRNEVIVTGRTPLSLGEYSVEVAVRDGFSRIATRSGRPGAEIRIPIKRPKLWSPESPHLYDMTVSLKVGNRTVDQVESYFGMRKISLGKDEWGFTRILFNNKPYFQLGPLDQGFWPEGLYTAPTDEALRYDIEMTKRLGFNMARKHVKIEPDRWYYWCDKLGLIVWQDMPSGDTYIGSRDKDIKRTAESGKQFEQELAAMIEGKGNHPCIVMWVPYNEGWGQWDTPRIVDLVRKLDPSRLVNNASGWTDRGVGDVNDMHKYPGPGAPEPEQNRAGVLGEYGGLGLPIRGHTWQSERNWGYRSFTNSEALAIAYEDLQFKLFPLIGSKGLSAAVYTQTTDVEVEVNGLLTYDREIIKIELKQVADANRGKFSPRPRQVDVVPAALTERATWRYTLQEPAAGWFKPEFNSASWKQGPGGFGTRGTPGAVVRTEWNTPTIWLRREFSLVDSKKDELYLLMHHDEDAEVYLNGVLAAKVTGYTSDYERVALTPEARDALKPGANVMAIRCSQTSGGQFIDAGLVRMEMPSRN